MTGSKVLYYDKVLCSDTVEKLRGVSEHYIQLGQWETARATFLQLLARGHSLTPFLLLLINSQ